MATDVNAIITALLSFYDFTGKTILHVGAGGGQLMAYAHTAKSVIAVDSDATALATLETALKRLGLTSRTTLVHRDWHSIFTLVDLVFFEFCLHEMPDPAAALQHASQLAPEILIIDHHPHSAWARCVNEAEKATRSWAAVHQKTCAKEETFRTEQLFDGYESLKAKVSPQGPAAMNQISEFRNCAHIVIPMDYTMALISQQA